MRKFVLVCRRQVICRLGCAQGIHESCWQSLGHCQGTQMQQHHIPVHNPVEIWQLQISAGKLRYAKKYHFHHFLKTSVILILSPHPPRC